MSTNFRKAPSPILNFLKIRSAVFELLQADRERYGEANWRIFKTSVKSALENEFL
jgi:hypothetical protein